MVSSWRPSRWQSPRIRFPLQIVVPQQRRLLPGDALRQQDLAFVGVKEVLRSAEMAQQRQPGLVVQPPQVRQPKPVFQQPSHLSSAVRRRSFYSVSLAASHNTTAAAAAALSDSQCGLMGIRTVRSQNSSICWERPFPSLPMAKAHRL